GLESNQHGLSCGRPLRAAPRCAAVLSIDGARDWSRTSTALRPPSPEPGASANSATRAIRGRRLGGASAGVNRLRVAYIAEMGRPRRPVKRPPRPPPAPRLDPHRVLAPLA